jgi:hypothetical protein
MQQLQAWADKGWYTFPCKQHPQGVFDGDGWEEIYNIQSNFRYNLADAVQLVLDGTIQVWRPVVHYKPNKGDYVIAIVDGMVLQGMIDRNGLFDDDARHCGVPFTYWQPEPACIDAKKENGRWFIDVDSIEALKKGGEA